MVIPAAGEAGLRIFLLSEIPNVGISLYFEGTFYLMKLGIIIGHLMSRQSVSHITLAGHFV